MKESKEAIDDFGQFDKILKVGSQKMPYKKMTKGPLNKRKYIHVDWIVKSLKYFEFDSLLAKFNIKLASKKRFKNSLFQHPGKK